MRIYIRFILIFFLISIGNLVFAWQENNPSDEDYTNTQEEEVITLRVIPDEHWQKIKADKGFIYSKPKPPKPKRQIDMGWLKALSPVLKVLLYILVALSIVVILFSILRNSEFTFLGKRKKKKVLQEGDVEDFQFIEDWEKALDGAIAQKNFRLGIRILYLQTLHLLDQHQKIQYKQDKTNWEYVSQLSTTPYGNDFTQLTKYFDYVWYGHFIIEEKGFQSLKNSFREFQKELRA